MSVGKVCCQHGRWGSSETRETAEKAEWKQMLQRAAAFGAGTAQRPGKQLEKWSARQVSGADRNLCWGKCRSANCPLRLSKCVLGTSAPKLSPKPGQKQSDVQHAKADGFGVAAAF